MNNDVYKIGNKVTGIIRAYSAGKIGNVEITYDNEPYEIFEGSNAILRFKEISSEETAKYRQSFYNHSNLYEVTISDILIDEKILNLIYSKSETPLCTKQEQFISDDEGRIFFAHKLPLYQVFVFDDEGSLETAYGTMENPNINVKKINSVYTIVYSYMGKIGYSFNHPNNYYLTLDLQIEGNKNDTTKNMFIHVHKCGLTVEKNLNFNRGLNTVTLTFKVLDDHENDSFITLDE